MKILITGGAGYIGNELVYRLAAASDTDEIVIYDNLARANYNLFTGLRKLPKATIRFVRGDILDTRTLHKLLDGVDVLYHLAATVSTPFASENPHAFEQTNNWGTAELVYAVEESSVRRFVYLSSAAVYGLGTKVDDVSTPARANGYYGISKLRGERHVERLLERLPTYIVRCANVYGYSKNLRVDAVINRLLFDAHFEGRISIHGSGAQRRPFISMRRAVDALYRLAAGDLPSGTYNLGDRNLAIGDVAATLRELYPRLEMIFVDQHMPMQDLEMAPDDRLTALCGVSAASLAEDLEEFRLMFTF